MTVASSAQPPGDRPGTLEIFLVAAEPSGDRLGAALMRALRQRASVPLRFAGVGGREMTAAGIENVYPFSDFSLIGFTAIPLVLPRVLRCMTATVRAILARRPHALVVIDSPSYTLWIARFVRLLDRSIPIVDYVSPSVWAWRSGRAAAMRRYVDHVLALLPFEPAELRRLGGPPCSYVGHPLIEEAGKLRPNSRETARRNADPPVVVALPGSRRGEIRRLSAIFGQTLGLVQREVGPIEVVVPTLPHLHMAVAEATASWPVRPRIVVDQAEKQALFRVARAALAKSGTITLELAIAGVPMVAAYKVSALESWIARRTIEVPSVILANLVLGQNIVPELLQESCTSEKLAAALVPLIRDTPERRRQVEAFSWLDSVMEIGSRDPSAHAADIVLGTVRRPAAPASAGAQRSDRP